MSMFGWSRVCQTCYSCLLSWFILQFFLIGFNIKLCDGETNATTGTDCRSVFKAEPSLSLSLAVSPVWMSCQCVFVSGGCVDTLATDQNL